MIQRQRGLVEILRLVLVCAGMPLILAALLSGCSKPSPPAPVVPTTPVPAVPTTPVGPSAQTSPAGAAQGTAARPTYGNPSTTPRPANSGSSRPSSYREYAEQSDPALRPDPKIVEQSRASFAKSPKRPLPGSADNAHSFTRWQTKADYWRKVFLNGFRANADRDPALAAQAEKFLDGYCLRISDSPEAPPPEQLVTLGQPLFEAKLDDPHVYLALCAVLFNSDEQNTPLFRDLLVRLDDLMRHDQPSTWILARYHNLRASVAAAGSLPRDDDPLSQEQLALIVDHLLQAGSAELTNADRQMLVFTMDSWASRRPASFRELLIAKLKAATGVDPWVRDVLLARHAIEQAWKVRGSGAANTVSHQQWLQFSSEIARARVHALNAWASHPELPEGASEMIPITMAAKGTVGESARFWLDEAVSADFLWIDAYYKYAWAAEPRWGGSHDEMLGFASECLATSRFDSQVPSLFHHIVSRVASERGDWKAVIRQPGIYQGYVGLFTGYAARAEDEATRRQQKTRLAAIAWIAGKKGISRTILQELGDAADPQATALFGVSLDEIQQSLETDPGADPSYFKGQPAAATAVAFVLNAQRLIAGHDNGDITVFNIESRQPEKTIRGHSASIIGLFVAPDDRLISAGNDGKIHQWSLSDWKIESTIEVSPPVHAAAISPDGTRLSISHGTGSSMEIVTFDWGSKQATGSLAVPGLAILPLAIGPDERIFFSPQPPVPEKILRWNVGQPKAVAANEALTVDVNSWQLSPDGMRMVLGTTRMERMLGRMKTVFNLLLVDVESGAIITSVKRLPARVSSAEFDSQGRVVATTEDGGLFVWTPGPGNSLSAIRTGMGGLSNLSVSADASHAAAIDGEGQIHVWPLGDGLSDWRIETPLLNTCFGDVIRRLWFTSDGNYLVVDAPMSELSLWDWESGLRTCTRALRFPSVTYGVDLFPDQRRVLCRTDSANVLENQILDMASGEKLESLPDTSSLAVSSTGNYFALAGGISRGITLFAGDDHNPLPWGKLPAGDIGRLTFTRDGTAFVTATSGDLTWWDIPSSGGTDMARAARSIMVGPPAQPHSLQVSADKSLIGLGLEQVHVYDVHSGQLLSKVPGRQVSFSPDSKTLIAAGGQNGRSVAGIYDARSGKLLVQLAPPIGSLITAVTFSPDGQTVLAGDEAGFVRAWAADSGERLPELAPAPVNE